MKREIKKNATNSYNYSITISSFSVWLWNWAPDKPIDIVLF
jgi:hypothetical protein